MKKLSVLFALTLLFLAGCAIPADDTVCLNGKDSYQVTLLGDIHYDGPQYHAEPLTERAAKLHYTQWKGISQQVLSAAAKQSKEETAFAVQLGDLINGDCDNAKLQGAALTDAFAMLKGFFKDKKLFVIRGHHDHRGKSDAVAAPARYLVPLLNKELGRNVMSEYLNYAIRYGRDLYIFYDYLSPDAGVFTRRAIAQNSDARHIFFLTHLPMFPCSIGNPGWVVPQFRELIPLLAKHNAVVICAHTHSMNYIIYKCGTEKLQQITVTSMGREWKQTPPEKVRCSSFDEWKKGIRPHYFTTPKYKWSIENLNFFRNEDFLTYRIGHLAPSGFVKLEINNERVSVHIFTDDSGKPAYTTVLKDK